MSVTAIAPKALLIELDREQSGRAIVVNKFGRNTAVGTVEEDVWETGATLVYPATAAAASIAFSGNDSSTGTHARKITVQGLDSSWDEAEAEVTLTAAGSPVSSTQTFIRINRAFVSEVGAAGNTNENAIAISVGGNVQATIGAGLGQTTRTHYTIPRNFKAYFGTANVSISATQPVDYRMVCRDRPDDATKLRGWRSLYTAEGRTGSNPVLWEYSISAQGPCDIRWAAVVPASSGKIDIDYTMAILADAVETMDGQV